MWMYVEMEFFTLYGVKEVVVPCSVCIASFTHHCLL